MSWALVVEVRLGISLVHPGQGKTGIGGRRGRHGAVGDGEGQLEWVLGETDLLGYS